MVTIRQLTKKLQAIKEDLQDKEIIIVSENGIQFEPLIKFLCKDNSLELTKENVSQAIITYE